MLKGFSKDFLFGVATSAYQIEGDNHNDWTEWETKYKIKKKKRLTSCAKATDHWKRYKEDFQLLKKLGVNAYRFSVEWSRIEPEPNQWNEDALQTYLEMAKLLKDLKIEPMVTLHHFTNPLWFHQTSPWHSEKSIQKFVKYAEKVISTLSPYVRYWISFNEPVVFLLGGYIDGRMPPGFKDVKLSFEVLKNMLLAHQEVFSILKDYCGEGGELSIAHNMMEIRPSLVLSPFDHYLAAYVDQFYNWMLVDAFATGELNFIIPTAIKGRINLNLKDTITFWGINYYSRLFMSFAPFKPLRFNFLYRNASKNGLTDMEWEIYPEGLEHILKKTHSKLNLPIIITENGIADKQDIKRIKFIADHLKILKECSHNLPINGYFYWSLLDNFEWLDGFSPRFGLYEVDYKTFQRKKRPSADFFTNLAKGEIEI
jgi:beta-glucosidase